MPRNISDAYVFSRSRSEAMATTMAFSNLIPCSRYSISTAMAIPQKPAVAVIDFRIRTCPGNSAVIFSQARRRGIHTVSATGDSQSDAEIPSWARPDSDELPPWASSEKKAQESSQNIQIPFFVYLISSVIVAIAAVGSMFEYANQKPVFGVINSDSIFYAPLLGFFILTGIPTSAYLCYKSVKVANEAADEQDKRDGYL